MADVRSLLRQERASRQSTGRPQKQSAAPTAAPISRKRKAADDGAEERKRTRADGTGVPADFFDTGLATQGDDASPPNVPQTAPEDEPVQGAPAPDSKPALEPAHIPTPPQPRLDAATQEELDAFFNEVDHVPTARNGFSAYSSGAVVEAAPMTAAEIAAQAREDQSAQRARKDEEMEGEKEDAARQLEDEFEEMEGLEERFKRLRDQREALRSARVQAETEDIVLPEAQPEVDDSESDDEDWDDWRFRPA